MSSGMKCEIIPRRNSAPFWFAIAGAALVAGMSILGHVLDRVDTERERERVFACDLAREVQR